MILDASAVLALLQDEPGAETVRAHLPDAAIVSVNLEEVVGILVREGMTASAVDQVVSALALPVLPFVESMAWMAGRLRARLPAGLGVADRCCLAAAAVTGRPVATADALWTDAGRVFDVEVVMIR